MIPAEPSERAEREREPGQRLVIHGQYVRVYVGRMARENERAADGGDFIDQAPDEKKSPENTEHPQNQSEISKRKYVVIMQC